MLFWVLAALVVTCLSLTVVLRPLVSGRSRAERRASYDMQVYRDQLGEIDRDLARGVLTPDEAQATRAEIGRRLLAAADAEAREPATKAAPGLLSPIAAGAVVVAVVAVAGGLYATIGAPGLRDQPLAARRAAEAEARANRPRQAKAEAVLGAPPAAAADPQEVALVERLKAVLKERPRDLEGHRLLARSLGALGRWAEAHAAQRRVIELSGDKATADDYVGWAELMILATSGYVSPEAEAALARALTLDPRNPLGRYYSGTMLVQGGRPDLAYRLWSGLLAEGPPNAPWIAPIRAQIAEVAAAAGLPPPAGVADAGAEAMAPEERQAMIEGMVAGLAERLEAEGGPPQDWAQLIRSLFVLGREAEGERVLAEARGVFAGDPAALATIEAAARGGAGAGPGQ